MAIKKFETFVDAEKNVVRRGDEVIYNHSGNLSRGVVVDIEERHMYGDPYILVYVDNQRDECVSKVRNTLGIIKVGDGGW